jgi:hypothetical protein
VPLSFDNTAGGFNPGVFFGGKGRRILGCPDDYWILIGREFVRLLRPVTLANAADGTRRELLKKSTNLMS